MAYQPKITPPPPTGNEAFDLWAKVTAATLQEFIVKSRTYGEGIILDEVDNPTLDISYLHIHASAP